MNKALYNSTTILDCGWASEASETTLYSGANHPLVLLDTRVQKISCQSCILELKKYAKSGAEVNPIY